MDEVERVFVETAEHYEDINKRLVEENKHLKQQLSNKNRKIRELTRVINKKKKKEKQHFKNGKRGTQKNGG
jgi:hypothetical protein